MRLDSITLYPVKSCYRVSVSSAVVEPWGLAGDRRWAVVDLDGRVVTQRVLPSLVLVRPTLVPTGLVLAAEGQPSLSVPVPSGSAVDVRIWRDTVPAVPAGSAADEWLAAVVGEKVRLVYLADPSVRSVEAPYGAASDRVSFADGFPLLAANAASLDVLNDWLLSSSSSSTSSSDPLPMTRFRPNVVISGAPGFSEDSWIGRRLVIGAVTFRAAKPCARCIVTTTDQETGVRGREPLRTLGQHRRLPSGLIFGVNLVPSDLGTITVGDPVDVVP